MMKKLKAIMVMTMVICLIKAPFIFALEVKTHENMNEYIGKIPVLGFSLDSYLKEELKFQEGVYDIFKSKKVSKWLGSGGIYEDKPPWHLVPIRSLNHFHDPLANRGYTGPWGTGVPSGESSIFWSQRPDATFSGQGQWPGGCYSWHDTRGYFYDALTARDKQNREKYFTETFRGLGQLMHLLQDLSVPEHARDDGHLLWAYEAWVKNNVTLDPDTETIKINGTLVAPAEFASSALLSPSPFPAASVPVASLFDSNQYDGSNPGVTNNMDIGMSEYTNANFLSVDTIFEKYPNPAPPDQQGSFVEIQDKEIDDPLNPGDTVTRQYYVRPAGASQTCGETNDGNGYLLAGVDYLFIYRQIETTGGEGSDESEMDVLHPMDPYVFQDYANLLIPKAVGYSAELLKYFFRGRLEVNRAEPLINEGGIWGMKLNVKNITPTREALLKDGTFLFSYRIPGEDPDGSEDLVRVSQETVLEADFIYEDEKEIIFWFYQPIEIASLEVFHDAVCTIAYQGGLGHEAEAVIGKVFNLETDLYLTEDWSSLEGAYPWQHTTADENHDNGITANSIVNGALIKENIRFADENDQKELPRYNSTALVLADANYPEGIPVDSTTYLQYKINEMLISNAPDTSGEITRHCEGVLLDFNDGFRIALYNSESDSGMAWTDKTAYWLFFPKANMKDNVYKIFHENGLEIPEPLYLKRISFHLQLLDSPDSDLETSQYTEIDYFRVLNCNIIDEEVEP